MKLIIAGSRGLNPGMYFIDELITLYTGSGDVKVTEVVSGGASGADTSGEAWAMFRSIPVKTFKPNWDQYGKSAGPRRNSTMADYGDVLLLIWDGESRGSASMKREMEKRNKPIWEIVIRKV